MTASERASKRAAGDGRRATDDDDGQRTRRPLLLLSAPCLLAGGAAAAFALDLPSLCPSLARSQAAVSSSNGSKGSRGLVPPLLRPRTPPPYLTLSSPQSLVLRSPSLFILLNSPPPGLPAIILQRSGPASGSNAWIIRRPTARRRPPPECRASISERSPPSLAYQRVQLLLSWRRTTGEYSLSSSLYAHALLALAHQKPSSPRYPACSLLSVL